MEQTKKNRRLAVRNKHRKSVKQVTLSKSKKVFRQNLVQREQSNRLAEPFQSSQKRKKDTAKHD